MKAQTLKNISLPKIRTKGTKWAQTWSILFFLMLLYVFV